MIKKPIAITGSNKSKTNIENILNELQRKTRVRNISYQDISESLTKIDEKLGISSAAMRGLCVTVDVNGQSFPRSYKYTPESTIFDAVHNGKYWVVTDIRRDKTKTENRRATLILTPDAKSALIKKFESFYI